MKSISTLIILIITTSTSIFGQTDWELISKKNMLSPPFKYVLKVQPIVDGDTLLGGTGFFISDRHILTNRHLVWNSRKKQIHQEILITAGFVGYKEEPLLGSVQLVLKPENNLFLPEDFLKGRNDFALIVLPDDSLFKKTNSDSEEISMFLRAFNRTEIHGKTLNLTGFTGWKKANKKKPRGRLYNSRIKFRKELGTGEMRYNSSSVRGGNSGSPIWIQIGDKFYVIGMHRRGAATINEASGRRHGVIFTTDKIRLINNWIKLSEK